MPITLANHLSFTAARLIEAAADELARLDALCSAASAPPAFSAVIRSLLLKRLSEPTRGASGTLAHWEPIVEAEERRAEGGGLLTSAQVAAMGVSVADPTALDDALRPGGLPRPVWYRALAAAAAIGDAAGPADLAAALLLCATGTTARLRFLLFAAVDPAERSQAIAAWRDGQPDEWARLALGAAAQTARSLRFGVVRGIATVATDEARLESLGRAAITARRALALLRERYTWSVPSLAADLGLSRPAASDALERLVELGVATEITGRGRDRVFALSSAFRLVALA